MIFNHLEEALSTNTWLLERAREEALPHLYTVYTFRQSAGRGQAGNAWESEPEKNLAFSTLFRIESIEQASRLNLLVPLAVVRALDAHLPATRLAIKWPNDIYYGDKKICGILNENVIAGGRITSAIAGIGINMNQEVFRSGAPNPISMKQITGHDYPLEPLLREVVEQMAALEGLIDDFAALKDAYMARLYRRSGWYPYVEREVSVAPTTIATQSDAIAPFTAEIADVDAFGRLVLRLQDGTTRTYHFKQIRFVL